MVNGQKGFTKYDEGKPDFTQLGKFPTTLAALCKHVRYGASKYGDDNWKLATEDDKKRYLAACFRHFLAYLGGKKIDEESDTCHIIPAITCLVMYYELEYGNAQVNVVNVEEPVQLDLFKDIEEQLFKNERKVVQWES